MIIGQALGSGKFIHSFRYYGVIYIVFPQPAPLSFIHGVFKKAKPSSHAVPKSQCILYQSTNSLLVECPRQDHSEGIDELRILPMSFLAYSIPVQLVASPRWVQTYLSVRSSHSWFSNF